MCSLLVTPKGVRQLLKPPSLSAALQQANYEFSSPGTEPRQELLAVNIAVRPVWMLGSQSSKAIDIISRHIVTCDFLHPWHSYSALLVVRTPTCNGYHPAASPPSVRHRQLPTLPRTCTTSSWTSHTFRKHIRVVAGYTTPPSLDQPSNILKICS
jgi:hypothetical protein